MSHLRTAFLVLIDFYLIYVIDIIYCVISYVCLCVVLQTLCVLQAVPKTNSPSLVLWTLKEK